MHKFQNAKGASHHLNFDGQLPEILVTSCLCPSFPVNGLVLFYFYCLSGLDRLQSMRGASHYLFDMQSPDMLLTFFCPYFWVNESHKVIPKEEWYISNATKSVKPKHFLRVDSFELSS